ncbi:diphosphoinositol polyphosphate phosphohydrolase DDP1 [Phycomyces blakesleeanus]|uniref:Diphosphoinositol polyphosphate phosphohydrolase DDP1 n=1 Tax=Phycomyces blakesleeanus TaxID=4837 RepID=A0ABR3B0J2_PHYBL
MSQIPNYPEARTGREKQLYNENNIRQVAGCIPIDPSTGRIMLISSSKHKGVWVIPKGGWENDETQIEAAMRETYEEAGVHGTVTGFVGTFFDYLFNGDPKTQFWIYELKVNEILDQWPEHYKRERRWFTYPEAMIALSAKPLMQEALSRSSLAPRPSS